MIQKVGRNASFTGQDRDDDTFLQGLLDDPKFLPRGPATRTAAIGDDLYIKQMHSLFKSSLTPTVVSV